ncbi:MAG: hypothetical protein ACK4ME_06985 [Fimbriimonadales bacterium]
MENAYLNSNKSVVLVVDKYSQDVHLAYSIAGVKYPVKYYPIAQRHIYTKEFFSILADLSHICDGVSVFFYRRRLDEPSNARGFLGEWRANSEPYEDLHNKLPYGSREILARCPHCSCPVSGFEAAVPICKSCKQALSGHILPLRFSFAPKTVYSRYLDDNTAYIDLTDTGRLSTLIFRKIYGAGRERSINPVLPEEAEKLRRLLHRVQQQQINDTVPLPPSLTPPTPSVKKIADYLDFQTRFPLGRHGMSYLVTPSGALAYETILEFWLIQQLVRQPQQVLNWLEISTGEQVEWFSNQVLWGIGGEKSDVLILTHDRETGLRRRAIIIELKKDTVNENALAQVKMYAYWVAQLVTAHVKTCSPFLITPVAIGHSASRRLAQKLFAPFSFDIPYAPPLPVNVETPRIYKYIVDAPTNAIRLDRVV